MIAGKAWGLTQTLFNKNNVEIHRIEINQGGFCSKHRHLHKYNAFFVERGKLRVSVWKDDYDLIDETIIEAGGLTVVEPGEFHQFHAMESTVAFEIYWVEITKDIERESCGGQS